jgi:sulfane dehydrogenase subunit SoxC
MIQDAGADDGIEDSLADEAPAAGGGLIHRRALLRAGLGLGGALGAGAALAQTQALTPQPWMLTPGAGFRAYGAPAAAEEGVARELGASAGFPTVGVSRTPLHMLEGTITPNGLHFERHHNGVPAIDPAQHRLLIHGLVAQPLSFSLEALHRYPMQTRIAFVECGGNSGTLSRAEAQQAPAGTLHGLLSCAEWTGVRLSVLLDEAGLDPGAEWLIAEGADGAGMSRSIPVAKALDDAILALYQNGELIRPEQGYPMRLLLPGFEGNTQVKWLHRLKAVAAPVHSRDETSRYTDLMADGRARQFVLQYAAKSIIVKPGFGQAMRGPGLYEISGLAWSGSGRVAKVEVSADGSASWAEAALTEPVLSRALTRFRLPWRWDGAPAILMSRATDEAGNVQPTRAAWMAQFAPGQSYHCNAIQSWGVAADGEISHVYA